MTRSRCSSDHAHTLIDDAQTDCSIRLSCRSCHGTILGNGGRCSSFEQVRDGRCPACLMAGADAGAVIAVEVFVEQKMIMPMGITLHHLGAAKNGSPAVLIF